MGFSCDYQQPPKVPTDARPGVGEGFVLIAEGTLDTGFELHRFGLYGTSAAAVEFPAGLRARLVNNGWSITVPGINRQRPAYTTARKDVCVIYDEFEPRAIDYPYVKNQHPQATEDARRFPFVLLLIVIDGCPPI
jgi:hypothetical protein